MHQMLWGSSLECRLVCLLMFDWLSMEWHTMHFTLPTRTDLNRRHLPMPSWYIFSWKCMSTSTELPHRSTLEWKCLRPYFLPYRILLERNSVYSSDFKLPSRYLLGWLFMHRRYEQLSYRYNMEWSILCHQYKSMPFRLILEWIHLLCDSFSMSFRYALGQWTVHSHR